MALPSLIGGNLFNSQTPLSFLLAVFPRLFVCSDLTRWRLETGQGGEGFGICTTHCPPHRPPTPTSPVLKFRLWGPRIRLLASRCQRDTFLFAVPPRLPSVCPSLRWEWQATGCFEKNLSSSSLLFLPPPPQTARTCWLLSITWGSCWRSESALVPCK